MYVDENGRVNIAQIALKLDIPTLPLWKRLLLALTNHYPVATARWLMRSEDEDQYRITHIVPLAYGDTFTMTFKGKANGVKMSEAPFFEENIHQCF